MGRTKKKAALVFNALFIPMEIYAITKMAINEKLELFKFYTNLSNILLLVTTLLYILIPIKNKSIEVDFPHYIIILRYLSTVMLSITFLLNIILLCPAIEKSIIAFLYLLGAEKFLNNILCPILSFVSFIAFEDNSSLSFKETFIPLVVTVIYGIISILLNIFDVYEGPYPFLEVKRNPVYQSILWNLGILIGCFVISFLIRFLYIRLNRENLRNTTALKDSANQMEGSLKKSLIYD